MDRRSRLLGTGIDRIEAHGKGVSRRRRSWARAHWRGSGFVLLFNRQIALGPLDWRIVPDVSVFAYAGLAVTIAGLGFMVWSRVALGRNWSASVTIKQDHDLVRSGPYAIVRHPLYAGVLLAMFGTTIFLGQIRGFIAFA